MALKAREVLADCRRVQMHGSRAVSASCSSRKTGGGAPCSSIRLSSPSDAVSSSAGTGEVETATL